MLKPVCVVVLCALLSLSASSQDTHSASDSSQEAALIQQFHTRVRYENDGTGSTEETVQIRIQSQAGVERYGQLRFGYSSATEKLDVNYVRVRKPGGQVIETPAANAQDFAPEGLQSAPMYTDFRERHVTVAALRPGDVLEYRTTTLVTTPLAAGEFWYEHSFPKYAAVAQARLDIDVPRSRELKLKSPKRRYTTSESGDRKTYSWVVENIMPDRKERDVSDDTPDDSDDSPDIQLTTFKDWQQVARWYAALQGERVVVDEAIQKKAAELTRGATTQQEKAEKLYDYVARDIRYVSLSFGVGRYQPHAAPDVMQGLYGDCKDKHTLLAALLRASGIQSYPVLIDSSRKLDEEIPSPAQFDHVITLASIDKNWVWLDATSEVAPYALLLYPLRDKQAVVAANDANGGLRRTPVTVPGKNNLSFSIDGKVSDLGALDSTVNVSASGDSAVVMRATFRSTSQADWKKVAEYLARGQGFKGQVSDVEVKELENTSRPFLLSYKYHDDSYFNVPSTGVSFYPLSPLQLPRLRKPKPTEPLELGPMMELHDRAHLQFAPNFTLRLPPEVRLNRDYADYSLSYRFNNGVLDAERNVAFKVSKLPASRRSDVQSLRSVVMSYAEQSISADVRLVAKSAAKTAVASNGSETAQELRKTGTKALQQRDFRTAAEMFSRLVEKEPKSSDGWDLLGRANAGLSHHADAIEAYRKQVEANPFNDRAYLDLGAELQAQGKLEEALDAYGKQLANVPVDRVARKYHGLLLAHLSRKEAVAELEAANTASPDDPEIELALAQLYSANGNQQKAGALMKSVIGGPIGASGDDLFAVALRDDINADETQTEAKNIIDTIDEQFDSKAFEDSSAEASSVMYFLALEWARIGWAKCLKGERLEGLRFMDSAWHLSQSATLADRMGKIYQKAGDTARARHFSLLSAAAGESETISAAGLKKAGASAGTAQAQTELLEMRTVKVPGLTMKKGKAEFVLVFSGSSRPERVEFAEGDQDLQPAEQALMDATYKVLFPDYSSLKIVRRGVLTCSATGCAMVLNPIQNVATRFMPSQTAQK